MASREDAFGLIVQCCRSAFDEARSKIDLPATPAWDELLALSRRHRVQRLVWSALKPFEGSIPDKWAEAFSADAEAVAGRNLRAAIQCAALHSRFGKAGLPVLFLKGLTLGRLAYGDPFLKTGWDIDILCRVQDIPAAAAVLHDLGYTPILPASGHREWHQKHKESVWGHSAGLHVELHSRLTDNRRLLPSLGAESPRQEVAITGQIMLPTLADEELFAYLCVHGASSAWFRLKWINDLAAVIHGRSQGEVRHLYERSQQLGAGRAASQALLLIAAIYGAGPIAPLAAALASDRPSRWLAAMARGQLLDPREPTERPLGTATIHLSQLLLAGPGFALAEFARQAAQASGRR